MLSFRVDHYGCIVRPVIFEARFKLEVLDWLVSVVEADYHGCWDRAVVCVWYCHSDVSIIYLEELDLAWLWIPFDWFRDERRATIAWIC